MNSKHYQTEPIWENPFQLKAIKFHDSSEAELLHVTLAAGENMVRHIPPVDVLFYILEGEPTVEVGNEKQVVKQETYIEGAAGHVTCVYNETDKPVRLLIFKTSKSTEPPVILK